MEEQDKKVNESLKQAVIDIFTKNGGEIDHEYNSIFTHDDYFKEGIGFKYNVISGDGTERLIVAFREDSEIAFMYDYYQIFFDFHNNYMIEEDNKNKENNNQLNTNDIIENNSTKEGIKKLIEVANEINKKGMSHIGIDSELKCILVYKIWNVEEKNDIETVCQSLINEIIKTCAIFFVESLPIMGIYVKYESEN
jgi:hypothetical protein